MHVCVKGTECRCVSSWDHKPQGFGAFPRKHREFSLVGRTLPQHETQEKAGTGREGPGGQGQAAGRHSAKAQDTWTLFPHPHVHTWLLTITAQPLLLFIKMHIEKHVFHLTQKAYKVSVIITQPTQNTYP